MIASSNGWQLFIENELTVRNLPSFEVAAARAELAIGPQRSLTMVRVAIVLVALAIVGGSAIGVAKFIPGDLSVKADQMRPAPATAIVNAKSLVVTTVSDGLTVPLPEMPQPRRQTVETITAGAVQAPTIRPPVAIPTRRPRQLRSPKQKQQFSRRTSALPDRVVSPRK